MQLINYLMRPQALPDYFFIVLSRPTRWAGGFDLSGDFSFSAIVNNYVRNRC